MRIPVVAWVLGCVALSACAGDRTVGLDSASSTLPNSQLAQRQSSPVAYRQYLSSIAAEVPAYAGHYVDENGFLVIAVSREEAANAASSALDRQFASLVTPTQRRRIQVVKWSYSQLEANYSSVQGHALAPGGRFVSTRIDPRKNQIVVGVEDTKHEQEVRRSLAASAVSEDMYSFEIKGRITPLADLNGRIRPMVAGLLATHPLNPSQHITCTLGPTAVRGTDLGFIVNSHCTPTTSIDGTIFYQKAPGLGADRIGVENYEPAPVNCTATYSGMPGAPPSATFYCRQADVVWIKLDASAATSGNTKKGYIARTTSGTTMHSTPWRVAAGFLGVTGSSVQKTGRITGTTSGLINGYCSDEFVPVSGLGYMVWQCQARAALTGSAGDSGSAVYALFSPLGADAVAIEGVMWGGANCQPVGINCTEVVYSPWSNVVADLGLSGWSAFLP